MDAFKRAANHKIGVGGYKCYCCGPSPKKRRRYRRMARRRLKQLTKKEFGPELVSTEV